MSDICRERVNKGAYESPYSGVGVEFEPTGVNPDRTGIVLHETGYLRENRDWNYPSVLSSFWRLYYNSRHGHSILFGERQIDLDPSRIVLIPDHQLFHTLGLHPTHHFWMAFSVASRLSLKQDVPVILSPSTVELELISELSAEIEKDENGEPTDRIRRLSLALLNVTLSRQEITWQDKLPEKLELAMAYIADNIDIKIPNAALAKHASMSVECLIRLFKKHLGITPGAYVMQVRIRFASQLLRQTEESIDQIAMSLSFPNRSYFSRAFKTVTGLSPAAFRKR